MKRQISIFTICAALMSPATGQELKPFTSDGCSAFPDGTLRQQTLWLSCCTAHDLAYWQGGTRVQREEADLALEQCVARVGEPQIAKLMLAGVRVGGSPYWPTKFRWGYGWPYFRGYKPLSIEELELVNSLKQDQ
ncbi:MAG: hypothetical protein R3332_05600 [Pseudohongiellaceae bacterium]|nr:hypothetical protein [Pseudohongiellaceae bacterium]